jgi:uncharacterized membrane protein
MTPQTVLSIVQIVATIASVVLIFIGLRVTVKNLDKSGENKSIPKPIISKSTKIILGGIAFYAVARFAANYFPMMAEEYDDFTILLQSCWQAIYTLGFIALIPYIINRMQMSRPKTMDD